MNKTEIFSIVKKEGHCNIDFSVSLNKITREEFNEIVRMTYYALSLVEKNIENKNNNNCIEVK